MKLYLIITLLLVIMGMPSIYSNSSYETVTDYSSYCEEVFEIASGIIPILSCNYPNKTAVRLDFIPYHPRNAVVKLYGAKEIEFSMTGTIQMQYYDLTISNCPKVTFIMDFPKASYLDVSSSTKRIIEFNNIANLTVDMTTRENISAVLPYGAIDEVYVHSCHVTAINIDFTQTINIFNCTIEYLNVSITQSYNRFQHTISRFEQSTIKYVDFLNVSHAKDIEIKNCVFGSIQPYSGFRQESVYITNNFWPFLVIVTLCTNGVTLLLAYVVIPNGRKVIAFLTGSSPNNHPISTVRDNAKGAEPKPRLYHTTSEIPQIRNIQTEIKDTDEEIGIPPHEDDIYEEIEDLQMSVKQNVAEDYIYDDIYVEKAPSKEYATYVYASSVPTRK